MFMNLKKQLLPLLLVVSLLLAACGGSETAAPAEVAPTEAPAVEATVAPEPTATEAPAAEAPAATEAPAAEVAASATTTESVASEAASSESAAVEGEAASYAVDVAASTVTWYGSKPIGASETGTVAIAEGQLNFAGEQLVDGTITIDMATIATSSQSGGMAKQLVDHLSSDDFFGVATYPTAKLVIKSAEATATANQYTVKGDLTIKETTKEIEFVADVTASEGLLNGTAEIIVNRADFDVRYNSGSFFSNLGDNLISDEMKLTVVLVAKKA